MNIFFTIILNLLLFFLITSFGLPILIDLILFFALYFVLRKKKYHLINLTILILLFTISSNLILNKNFSEKKKFFYRAHERFTNFEGGYKKKINIKLANIHGDLISLDYCNKNQNLADYRDQIFITDQKGYRNDKYKLEESEIVLVGDSFIVGSSISQEFIPANILSDITGKKVYSLSFPGGPKYYEKIIGEEIENMNSDAKIYLFYFEGNDFSHSLKKNNKYILSDGNKISYLKYKIKSGYNRLERNKDKLFIKILHGFYKRNYFYKSIRPKSQRLVKCIIAKWTETCPVFYHQINNIKVGFYYKSVDDDIKINSHIIKDKEILNKIYKIFFIPTKYSVYRQMINFSDNSMNRSFNYLKNNYSQSGIEVIDLTEILIESAKKNIKENKVIYWTDDTHWNHLGIIDTMKFISYKIIF